jgi:hypothetical protein
MVTALAGDFAENRLRPINTMSRGIFLVVRFGTFQEPLRATRTVGRTSVHERHGRAEKALPTLAANRRVRRYRSRHRPVDRRVGQ